MNKDHRIVAEFFAGQQVSIRLVSDDVVSGEVKSITAMPNGQIWLEVDEKTGYIAKVNTDNIAVIHQERKYMLKGEPQ